MLTFLLFTHEEKALPRNVNRGQRRAGTLSLFTEIGVVRDCMYGQYQNVAGFVQKLKRQRRQESLC